MTEESNDAQAEEQVKCPNCGAAAWGKYCSECGASLTGEAANAYLLFVDSFFKVGELRRYLGLYWRIVRSPTAATLALFETSSLADALRFLEYSAGILVMLFLSQLIAVPGSDLLSGLAVNIYFVLAQSVGLLLHYRFAVGWARPRRSFPEFMRLAGFFYGFTLPISGALQAVSLAQRMAGNLLFIAVTLPLLVYAVRVWRHFWGAPAWVVFLLLFFSSLAGALIGLLFIGLLGVVTG